MGSKKRRWRAEERLLVALVRGEPLGDFFLSCRPAAVRELASRHLLTALLASEILRQGIKAGDSLHWAAATLLSYEREAALYDQSLRRIRTLLSANGIPTIVLKGKSLAFGKPRDIGDIDLLVPEAALIGAIGLVEAEGYAYVGYLRNKRIKPRENRNWRELMKWANQFEFQDPETGALLELHTTFFEKDRVYAEDLSALNVSMGSILDSCRPDPGTGCLFLSMEDRVLLLALQADIKRAPYRHNFVLRHVSDFDGLLEAGFDWRTLMERAKRYRILPHVYSLICLYRLFFDAKIPAPVFDAIRSALRPSEIGLVRLQLRCLRDLRGGSYGAALIYRFFIPFVLPSTNAARIKSLLIAPLLFPQSWRLAEIYGVSPTAKSRFFLYALEPFRWVALLLKKTGRLYGR
jgi:hypothetical protein